MRGVCIDGGYITTQEQFSNLITACKKKNNLKEWYAVKLELLHRRPITDQEKKLVDQMRRLLVDSGGVSDESVKKTLREYLFIVGTDHFHDVYKNIQGKASGGKFDGNPMYADIKKKVKETESVIPDEARMERPSQPVENKQEPEPVPELVQAV